MSHFFSRAMKLRRNSPQKKAEIDENLLQAAAIAEKVAPYRHAQLSAMKLAGDPNAHKEIGDDAPIEELKKLFEMHLMNLAPVLDLQILPLNGMMIWMSQSRRMRLPIVMGRKAEQAMTLGSHKAGGVSRKHRGGIGHRRD
jgi:hypothetical protein